MHMIFKRLVERSFNQSSIIIRAGPSGINIKVSRQHTAVLGIEFFFMFDD